MDAGQIELAAVARHFEELAERWRLDAIEVEVLLGLDEEGRGWDGGRMLSVVAETRLRLLCELDHHLASALGEHEIADWLRTADLKMDPLTFLSLGVDEIRAMIVAAKHRSHRLNIDYSAMDTGDAGTF